MTEKQAVLLVESYKMYQVRRDGMMLENIGERFGVTKQNAWFRVRKIEKHIAKGELDTKLKEAQTILASSKKRTPVGHTYCERRPVRTSSGVRFTPL